MLSKITAIAFVSASEALENRELLRNLKNPKPRVEGTCDDALFSVTRLKKGPANIDEVKASFQSTGTKWSDTEWTGKDVLFKKGYGLASREATLESYYDDGSYVYKSWTDVTSLFSASTLFKDSSATFTEANQGAAETSYFINSIASAAEWPSLITDMFVTGTDMSGPNAGIIGVKFYIRGKPWVVTVDDKLFFSPSG